MLATPVLVLGLFGCMQSGDKSPSAPAAGGKGETGAPGAHALRATPEMAAMLDRIVENRKLPPAPALVDPVPTAAIQTCVLNFNNPFWLSRTVPKYPDGYPPSIKGPYTEQCGPGYFYIYQSSWDGGYTGTSDQLNLYEETGLFCYIGGSWNYYKPWGTPPSSCKARDASTVPRVLVPDLQNKWIGIAYVGTTHSHVFQVNSLRNLANMQNGGYGPGSKLQFWYKWVGDNWWWQLGNVSTGSTPRNIATFNGDGLPRNGQPAPVGAREVLINRVDGSTNNYFLDDLKMTVL